MIIIFIPKLFSEYLMRFFFCKTRCPSICFCPPSQTSSSSPSLQLPDTHPVPDDAPRHPPNPTHSAKEPPSETPPSLPASADRVEPPKITEPQQTLVSDQNNIHVNGNVVNSNGDKNHHHPTDQSITNGNADSNCTATTSTDDGNQDPKGSLRKIASDSALLAQKKKKVQWVDHVGKQLADIREFEYIEDMEDVSKSNRGCECSYSPTWILRLSVSISVAIVQFSSSCLRSMHIKRKR